MSIEDRIQGALLGLAVGDALGAPVEFVPRDTFSLVTEMLGGGPFNLPPGAWTDDTAMALCLADSLAHNPDLDVRDLLDRFCRWLEFGENSSTGKSVGVGQNTLRSLGAYRRTGSLNAKDRHGRSDGNGAIMRLAPIPMLHWPDPAKSKRLARIQSEATHASELSAACCELLSDILCELIAGKAWADVIPRAPESSWPLEVQGVARGDWQSKSRDEISSSGYVIHTLEAALWCVDRTATFEEALVLAVNLGDDADTAGAVTGQIAGARYGENAVPGRWVVGVLADV